MNPRLAAVKAILDVLDQGRNLPDALQRIQSDDPALSQAIAYGVCRWYSQLSFILQQLMDKPLKSKDHDIHCLLLCGLFQLRYMRIPDHAAVSESVKLADKLKKKWARGLVNAVLRNYSRQLEKLEQLIPQDEQARYAHPQWIIQRLKKDWPEHWPSMLEANNHTPPMTLRVDLSRLTREEARQALMEQGIVARPGQHSPAALVLEQPVNVHALPGFDRGLLSVQDEAAQLAALLLDAQDDARVLDACAAPGGKTLHILETAPKLRELVALEIDARRMQRVKENLSRSDVAASLIEGDASTPPQWWDGQAFDRILLDAPCSASGVIRRHPDIKLLRRETDLPVLTGQQAAILDALWPLLKPGGRLLYATCSVFREENELQIQAFLQRHQDARPVNIELPGQPGIAGTQILPGEDGMDGFFYALLQKN